MSNGDDSVEKVDPTALVVRPKPEPESVSLSPTGLATDGEANGIIDLQIPNLLPTDNMTEERTVKVIRTKIPVRITHIEIDAIDNGYIVHLPQAGRQHEYHGPDGSRHVFPDKAEMLEFIGKVVGQVTYQYNESELQEAKTTAGIKSIEAALEAGHDVELTGHGPIMVVQR